MEVRKGLFLSPLEFSPDEETLVDAKTTVLEIGPNRVKIEENLSTKNSGASVFNVVVTDENDDADDVYAALKIVPLVDGEESKNIKALREIQVACEIEKQRPRTRLSSIFPRLLGWQYTTQLPQEWKTTATRKDAKAYFLHLYEYVNGEEFEMDSQNFSLTHLFLLAYGLVEAHKQFGFLHRDLRNRKNLMLQYDDEEEITIEMDGKLLVFSSASLPKVVDYGNACTDAHPINVQREVAVRKTIETDLNDVLAVFKAYLPQDSKDRAFLVANISNLYEQWNTTLLEYLSYETKDLPQKRIRTIKSSCVTCKAEICKYCSVKTNFCSAGCFAKLSSLF